MNNKAIKILGLILFPFLLGLIFYIAFSVDYEQPYKITLIEINGGKHLTNEKYFSYAGLNDKLKYDELTLPIIKSRLEKHPYVKRAEVLYVGNGKVEVSIIEKDFWAILITGDREFVLTQNFEVLPVLKYSREMFYPVITVKTLAGKLKEYDYVKKNKTLKPVFKLLEASKMINPQLYDNLSEVNYLNNGEINLYFTFADYELKMNLKNVIEELYDFNELWKYIKHNSVSDEIEYIDLRFNGRIFLGMKNNLNAGSKT